MTTNKKRHADQWWEYRIIITPHSGGRSRVYDEGVGNLADLHSRVNGLLSRLTHLGAELVLSKRRFDLEG